MQRNTFKVFKYLNIIRKYGISSTYPQQRNFYLIPKPNNFISSSIKYYSLTTTTRKSDVTTELESTKDNFNLRPKVNNLKELIQNSYKHVPNYKQIVKLLPLTNFDDLSTDETIILLNYTGALLPNYSKDKRDELCQLIYSKAVASKASNIDIHNTFIKTCTENGKPVHAKILLSIENPNQDTYKSLLENSCELGRINEAVNILEIMKQKQVPVDEDVFNNLLLVHIINGNLAAGNDVLKTMKTAKIPESINTQMAKLRGLAISSKFEEFVETANSSPQLNDDHLLKLLETLGSHGNHAWINELPHLFERSLSRDNQEKVKDICLHLIRMNKEDSAFFIYEKYVDPSTDPNYGFILLRDMLHCNQDINKIIKIAKELRERELNATCLENLTNLALRNGYTDSAWMLLKNLNDLKPHYFWPILATTHKRSGEQGVMEVMAKIQELNVHLDFESLQNYIFRYCDVSEPEILIKNIQQYEYTVTEILSPLIAHLLTIKDTNKAAYLCKKYHVPINGDDMLHTLARAWINTRNSKNIVELLTKYCESNVSDYDNVGEFLIYILNSNKLNLQYFDKLLQEIKRRMLRVTYNSSETIQSIISSIKPNNQAAIEETLKNLTEFGLTPEASKIPHPRDMSLEQLECHLEELIEKKMETRGVLRKLIQRYSAIGNQSRVGELRAMFIDKGYTESAGMKSSIMHSYIEGGHLQQSLQLFEELKENHPDFNLDTYKIVDLATLLIQNNNVKEAFDVITWLGNKGNVSSKGNIRNVCNLLSSLNDIKVQADMLNILQKYGYIANDKMNIALGSIMRLHLNTDLQQAVQKYEELSKKYNCTPLQLELLNAVMKANNLELINKVLDTTENVHGKVSTLSVFIASLAENGLVNKLQKVLGQINDVTIARNLNNFINKRCERWVLEKKIDALKNLAKASEKIHSNIVNKNVIFNSIMKIYSSENDYESALELFNELSEEDLSLKKELSQPLIKIFIKCNSEIPDNVKFYNS